MEEKAKPCIFLLQCGVRDDKRIVAWVERVKNTPSANIANLISQAVEYHHSTGKYLLLGRIQEPKEHKNKRTSIYVNQKSDFFKIIQEAKANDTNISKYIKTILYRGIVYTDGREYIPSQYDELKEVEEPENDKTPIIKTANEGKSLEDKPKNSEQQPKEDKKEKNLNSLAAQLLRSDMEKGFGLGGIR